MTTTDKENIKDVLENIGERGINLELTDGEPMELFSTDKFFVREDRYTVIKNKDLHYLSKRQKKELSKICTTIREARLSGGRKKLRCVIIEDDWPEYETVWEMIRKRFEVS